MSLVKYLLSFSVIIGVSTVSFADEPLKRVIEDVPPITNLYHVSAAKTPSGFAVPRYVSLKVGFVNGRTGPSLGHPIAWQYKRKGLPLIIVAETDMWRKVRDIKGDESWIHKPAISGERFVITLENTSLHTKPSETAKVTAIAHQGALLNLIECNEQQWCRLESEDGLKGWSSRHKLWGAKELY